MYRRDTFCKAHVQVGGSYQDYIVRIRLSLIVQTRYFLQSSRPGRDESLRLGHEEEIGFDCTDMILLAKLMPK